MIPWGLQINVSMKLIGWDAQKIYINSYLTRLSKTSDVKTIIWIIQIITHIFNWINNITTIFPVKRKIIIYFNPYFICD